MPCYDSRNDHPHDCTYEVASAKREFRHNSDVAEMLCSVLTQFEAEQRELRDRGTTRDPYPKTVREAYGATIGVWWEEHKERDRKKAEREKAQKKHRIVKAQEALAKAERELTRALKGR